MKTILITSAFLLLVSSILGQITVNGEAFTNITIQGNSRIYIRQDSVCSVRYSGNDNPSDAEVSVNQGTLNIGGNLRNELNVSLPNLKEIRIGGQGSVTGVSTFISDELNLVINGDGKIILDVSANKINSKISGIGKITLSGTVNDVDISIPGSGKIDAMGLKTSRCNVNISGIGKCMIDVSDELTTNISGSGTVTYKTAPKKISENITGVGSTKSYNENDSSAKTNSDTTRITIGKDQVWIIGKKDYTYHRNHKVKPIWGGFEMGINSYVNSDGTFAMKPGAENFELRLEKSISVGLNLLQAHNELGKSNIWFFYGLGITWNNYRFDNDVILTNGPETEAIKDTSSDIGHIKSKLVAIYLTSPIMFEVFTSRSQKKAFHLGAGGILGLRIGAHTKRKYDIDGDVSKQKEFDSFNLVPFRYGFRVAIGYGRFNIYADYYASTLFKNNEGPKLYPVNAGITFIGF